MSDALHRLLGVSVLALSALAPACAMRPPIQNSGAVVSPNGVALAVRGQRCSETVETDFAGAPLVETHVQVEIRNDAPPPVVVHFDAFRLKGPDGRAVPVASWEAKDRSPIEAGEAQTFELRFMSRGGLSCTKPMQLESAAGVTKGDRPVQLGSVTFVPSRA